MIVVDNPGSDDLAYGPIKHADRNGWTSADLIFPSFLFLVGISMVFSFAARLRRGESRKQILFHALKRGLVLIAIGLFVNASPIIGLDVHTWRFEGVTQRIALCYFAATILVLWSNHRGAFIAMCACLLGYRALLRFVPVPGFGLPGRNIPFMDPDRNLVAWLDRKLFMGHLFDKTRDPEGLLSTIPAIATTLIGVLTGYWLRSGKSAGTKAIRMLCVGILGLVAGEVWNLWCPINKNLWTSSFVLFSGGFALVFLALLYWVLEIKRWRGAWTMPILVFGMNAIAGFVADSFVYGPCYSFTVNGPNGPVMWHDAARPGWCPSAPAHPMPHSFIPLPRCCSAGFCCGSSAANESSLRSEGHASLRRMRPGEVRAARLLHGLEFHELDSRQIGIKHIELPLAVFAHLRLFVPMRLPAVSFQNSLCPFHVSNAERDVIQHAHPPRIRMLGLVHHIFQPIRAVRNLDRHPVGLAGTHSSMPVGTKPEQFAVEVIFGIAVVN
jgi:predicted acyltransferase